MAKVLFLQNVWVEYYGVMQISALLKQHGHEVDITFEEDNLILEYINQQCPDIIALSCMSVQWNWAKDLSLEIKKRGIETPIIIGGVHVSMYPEVTIEHPGIDILCLNEGEFPMLELCECIDKGKDYSDINNLWIKKEGKIIKNRIRPKLNEDILSGLPYADRYLYSKYEHFKNYPFVIIVGTRGCPFQCTFCEIPEINSRYGGGKAVYYRYPESLIDEIYELKTKGLLEGKMIMFTDSTFNSRKKWFMAVMKLYKERIGVSFSCNLRVDLVDEAQIKALKDAGCDNVRYGVESGDEDVRNKVLNKKLSDEKLFKCADLLKQYGIPQITFNLFGSPGETYEQAWKTIYMNQRIQPSAVSSYIFLLFPGLRATEEAIAQGRINREDIALLDIPPYNFNLSLLALHPNKNPEITKICNLQKFSILVVRYPFVEPFVRLICNLPPYNFFGLIYSLLQTLEWRNWSTKATLRKLLFEAIINYNALVATESNNNGLLAKLSNFFVKRERRGKEERVSTKVS